MDINEKIIEDIICVLNENFIFIEKNDFERADLSNFIEDSLQFISLVVALEEMFAIEFPDELLLYDNFKLLPDLYVLIDELLKLKARDS